MGVWYEAARYPVKFEDDEKCVVTKYMKANGTNDYIVYTENINGK